MSTRVYAWDANPAVDPRLYRLSNNRAKALVLEEIADFITLADGRRAIQLRPKPEEVTAKSAARTCLVPFGRLFNKLMHPPSLNYPIPFVGALRLTNSCRAINELA